MAYVSPIDRGIAVARRRGMIQDQELQRQRAPLERQVLQEQLKDAGANRQLRSLQEMRMFEAEQRRILEQKNKGKEIDAKNLETQNKQKAIEYNNWLNGMLGGDQTKWSGEFNKKAVEASKNKEMGDADMFSYLANANPEDQKRWIEYTKRGLIEAGWIKSPSSGQTFNFGDAPPDPRVKAAGEEEGKAIQSLMGTGGDVDQAKNAIYAGIEAERSLDRGIISGQGASLILGAKKLLNQLGLSVDKDKIESSEAYMAALTPNVANIITAFGAGTGLSDADREFAQNAAGANISLSIGSLRRILDINRRYQIKRIQNARDKWLKNENWQNMFEEPAVPNIPGLQQTKSAKERIKEIASWNEGVEPDKLGFKTAKDFRDQLKQEGYDVSKLTNDEIIGIAMGGAIPNQIPNQNSSEVPVTATGPNGERLILRNGQWIPIN